MPAVIAGVVPTCVGSLRLGIARRLPPADEPRDEVAPFVHGGCQLARKEQRIDLHTRPEFRQMKHQPCVDVVALTDEAWPAVANQVDARLAGDFAGEGFTVERAPGLGPWRVLVMGH